MFSCSTEAEFALNH